MSSQLLQFKLNMPAPLKRRLAVIAEKNGRTLTAEIVSRLMESPDVAGHLEALTLHDTRTLDLFVGEDSHA